MEPSARLKISSESAANDPEMRLYAYVVARDFGFAPNPFYGACTLATCKPKIREAAQVGDMIVGIGSVPKRLGGRIIFAMVIDEITRFDEYWHDPRFVAKRPYLSGSTKQRYGDNIYHCNGAGKWLQEDSHHSFAGGVMNSENMERDVSSNRVLIGREFYYFGRNCPEIPHELADLNWPHPGHKCSFPAKVRDGLVKYLRNNFKPGIYGLPNDWR